MDKRIAANVAGIQVSAIKEMAMRSARVANAASLTWGVPSFQTPEHIRAHVTDRLANDVDIGKYALPDGLAELRQLVARTHQQATGVTVNPDENVLITAGNMQGLNSLFHVLLDIGDEVILTDPGFASHVQQIKLCGGRPVYWSLDEESGWSLDVPALERLITARTKAIVVVSPSNPTGTIFTEDQLRDVAALAAAHNLMVLVDDPYHHFCYENSTRYFNLASDTKNAEHIAYLFTFSKSYAMSGWRVGYMVVPQWLKAEVLKVHDATLICTPRISQVAAIAALSRPAEHLVEFTAALARRRTLICDRLEQVPHVFSYRKPEGAYYVFPRIIAAHEDSTSFAIRLLEDAKVTVTPGRAFGPQGEHHVRMAYCVEEAVINAAFDRIESHFGPRPGR